MESIIRKLEAIEVCLKRLREIEEETPIFLHYQDSWRTKDIVERNLHKIIETFIDIGKIIISDKRVPEPSNNREVFMILHENKLMVGLRNILVHSYDRIDDSITYGILKRNLSDVEKIKFF